MGSSLVPLVFLSIVSAIFAIPLCLWSTLPIWLSILISPVVAWLAIMIFGATIDFFERPRGEAVVEDSAHSEVLLLTPLPDCPSCGSAKAAHILYGLPSLTDELQQAIDEQRVVLGGCIFEENAPAGVCIYCGYKFHAGRD